MTREHVDVLIVGAGLSGIGAAVRLRQKCPGKSIAVLESRDRLGGTWDLFRYPGIRSDSDMYTLAYPFKPWSDPQSIADGGKILAYLQETAAEHRIDELIRYGTKVVAADWSSEEQRWTVEAIRQGERTAYTCSFLYLCTGYYNYDRGHVVDFAGQDRFRGELIHPQFWPEGADMTGKRVVIIGSGATAVTLLPALADAGAVHVTMLQRSPTYVVALPGSDAIANGLRKVLPAGAAHAIIRTKNVLMNLAGYQAARRFPRAIRAGLQGMARRSLPPGYDMSHFTPRYDPWDERLCVVPDGDLFEAVSSGRASVVTGNIDRFTEQGILLASGRELAADVIVTATGLDLVVAGNIEVRVDGTARAAHEGYVYKGCMMSDVPNFAWTVGYTNSSWTLRADLVAKFLTRLLRYLDANGYTSVTPRYDGPRDSTTPLIDLTAGYVQRAKDKLPKQGAAQPWVLRQNYLVDSAVMAGRIDDGHLEFARVTP